MNQDILRSTIRNILIETRANLPIRPLMKIWWKVAAKYGEPDTIRFQKDTNDFNKPAHYGYYATLRVPAQHKHKVFDEMTPEAQEWVLRHWKTREYFGNMITGVVLAVIKEYPNYETAVGMKSGRCQIKEGTWNAENKTWIGGMTGFLTMKTQQNYWNFEKLFADNRMPTERFHSSEINRHIWEKEGLDDLVKSDSVLVHEFQHWFQESVMYGDARLKKATRGTEKGKYTQPKEWKKRFFKIPNILHMILEQVVDGVDWQNPKMHPNVGLPMYEIIDYDDLMDSVFVNAPPTGGIDTVWPMMLYGTLGLPAAWLETFLQDTMKLPLTPKGLASIGEHKTSPLMALKAASWDIYSKDLGLFDTDRMTKEDGHFDDDWVEHIKRILRKADEPVVPLLVPKSHIVKKTLSTTAEVKPNKYPINTTVAQLDKDPVYIMFAKSVDWRKRATQEYTKDPTPKSHQGKFEKARNPIEGWNHAWAERWVEYDAESRNYLSGIVKDSINLDVNLWRAALAGDEQKISKILFDQLYGKLRRGERIDRRILMHNRKELETLCERSADRIIEVVERYDPDWFRDPSNRGSLKGYGNIMNTITNKRISEWLDPNGPYIPSHAWGGYWKFIHNKVIGEI